VEFVCKTSGVTGENMKNAQFLSRTVPFGGQGLPKLRIKEFSLEKENERESMVVRNPAPDASPPMVQTEHREFTLSY
jgi:hypothetical protein